jgi:hypothetical protein
MMAAQTAIAQFGTIFNEAPRPPGNIPNRPAAPAPLGLPQQMPPEEMDEDAANPPPTASRPLPQSPPRTPPQYQVPGAIRSQPLPPPPGVPADTQQSGLPRGPGGQPGQIAPPGGGQPVLPPGQQPRGTPQPANTAPQPGDEVITELPSQKIANPTAVFAGLDKITGRIIAFDVAINETVQFGALRVTPHICYTRPPTEAPNTDTFVDVDEVTLQGEVKRIFTGWMFAASPGLHAVEHPIYDVWLTDCKGGTSVVADTQPTAPAAAPTRPQAKPPAAATAAKPPATPTAPRQAVQQPTLQQPQPQLQQSAPQPQPPVSSGPRR